MGIGAKVPLHHAIGSRPMVDVSPHGHVFDHGVGVAAAQRNASRCDAETECGRWVVGVIGVAG